MNSLLKRSSKLSIVTNGFQFSSTYFSHHEEAISHPDKFWRRHLNYVDWFKKPTTILDQRNPPYFKWFPDGELNLAHNCIDRHLTDQKNDVAFHYISPVTNSEAQWTYQEVYDKVSRLAGGLKDTLGVKKGDRVIIYMPMVPESISAMLACTRIGAIHSVVFGGFAAPELASRIRDAGAKTIITCSYGIEVNKRIEYMPIVQEALQLVGDPSIKVIMYQRNKENLKGVDYDYYNLLENSKPTECVRVMSNDPAYILYTSGTTGAPKGVVRDTGGIAISMSYCMDKIFDIQKRETMFAGSDIGWVVGHQFTVYGPLLRGAKTVIFEGKPVQTPDAGTYWRVVEKAKVKHLYTAPTAIRAIRRDDREGSFTSMYDISSLKAISLAGERCDIPTYRWLQSKFPKITINDNYWQTESGWPICSNYLNLTTFDMKPGSACRPVPGFNVKILDENGVEIKDDKLGRVCIKMPTPPSFALTLWNNDKAYKDKYFSVFEGFYLSGDIGYKDADGYFHIMTRDDDVINTAGHRLSTAALEEVIMHHDIVAEAVVIGVADEIKGEIPIGFVTLKEGNKLTTQQEIQKFEKNIVSRVRHEFGPVASFKTCIIVDKLPKTRSGKYLRNIMRKMANHEAYKIPPTIEDSSILIPLDKLIKSHGFGKDVNIEYEQH